MKSRGGGLGVCSRGRICGIIPAREVGQKQILGRFFVGLNRDDLERADLGPPLWWLPLNLDQVPMDKRSQEEI